jgi:hypothetical protein
LNGRGWGWERQDLSSLIGREDGKREGKNKKADFSTAAAKCAAFGRNDVFCVGGL